MEIVKIKWFPEIRRREGWIDRGQKSFGAENTVYDTIMVDRSHFNLSNNRLYNAKSEITHIIHFRWWWFVNVDSTLVKNTLPWGEGNGTPLQYFCLENPMDSGAWWAAVHGVARVGHDWATSLSLFTFMYWRRKWQPTPVFLPGESQGRGSLVGCRLWGRTESDTTEVT